MTENGPPKVEADRRQVNKEMARWRVLRAAHWILWEGFPWAQAAGTSNRNFQNSTFYVAETELDAVKNVSSVVWTTTNPIALDHKNQIAGRIGEGLIGYTPKMLGSRTWADGGTMAPVGHRKTMGASRGAPGALMPLRMRGYTTLLTQQ